MCGFVAEFNPLSKRLFTDEEIIKSGERMSHRGPDDFGFYSDGSVSMYFRRLSILDLSKKGHQPMFSSNKEAVLVFNGEIYNYLELRSELSAKGYQFNSTSDTEVLLCLYLEYGKEFVKKLRGMFSFVIWDMKKNRFVVCRDRLGIKPLYIYRKNDSYIISSEIKSILSLDDKAKEVDEKSIFKFLSRNFADDTDDTFFSHIKSFPSSTMLILEKHKNEEFKYWDINYSGRHKYDKDEFLDIFKETVSIHLRSDVPVALTLSGGMDSSSIAGIVKKYNLNDIKAYTVVPDDTIDEKIYIDKIVSYLNLDHEYVYINEVPNFSLIIDDILMNQDEPIQYSSWIYQYILRKMIKDKGIKVLLVGEGGDEVLAGYRRMLFQYLLAVNEQDGLKEILTIMNKSASLINKNIEFVISDFIKYIDVVYGNGSGQENLSAYDILNTDICGKYSEIIQEPMYINSTRDFEESFFELLKKHLFQRNVPFVLRAEDRVSMSQSIESRVPYLDHVLIEKVFSYDFREFMFNAENKSMLRRSMKDILPAEVINRKDKSNRPKNDALIVYSYCKKEIIDMLKSDEYGVNKYLNVDSLNMFIKDAEMFNRKSAEVWFRIFIVEKWLRLIKKI